VVLVGRSKRVPQLIQAADHLVGATAKIGVHGPFLAFVGEQDFR
jgi:hypothetical protein